MFDPSSRYYSIEDATLQVPDSGTEAGSRDVAYKRRRFLPPPVDTPVLEHTVIEKDRLDNIAARYIGDPLQFWRVCDVNTTMMPSELTDEPGATITLPTPAF